MIELRCLGSIDVKSPEHGPATRVIAQPKRYALLAYLALANPRGFHRRDTLIALFWPESDDEHARSGLRIGLSFLRRELGDDVIITRGDDVAVSKEAVRCDVDEFESALNAGDLKRGMSLYNGDLLPGLHVSRSPEFERWLESERERLRRRAHDAALKLSAKHESAGDWEDAIKRLRFALDLAPDNEAVVQRLIPLFDRAGDRAGAFRTYASFAQRMATEFDAEPAPETQALIAGIRARSGNQAVLDRQNTQPSASPLEPAAENEANETRGRSTKPGSSDRRGLILAMGSAAALMLLASSTMYWRSNRASAAPVIATDITPSLAVLPFENLGETDDSYFVAGMTDEISSKLGSLAGLTVIGRQSAKRYANSDKPPQQIGRELGATYLLTGTVRWDQSMAGRKLVRITPVLVRASNGAQLWSEPYEGEATGVFDIQGNVATRVAEALRLNLSRTDRQSLVVRPTNSAEAYDHFLRARSLGSIPGRPSEFLRAVALLERAVQLDPKFALGYAALGVSHLNAYWSTADDNPHRLEWAKAAIDTALAIDPKLPAGYVATATYYYRGKFDYQRALDALVVAERLAPNDPDVMNLKGLIERPLNRWTDAIADHQRAVRLDPRNADFLGNLCQALRWARRYAEANKACSQLTATAPDKWSGYELSYALAISRGDIKAALAIARQAESRVDREEFRSGLLDNGGWPALFDPHLLSEMESVRSPVGARARVNYFATKLYLSVYKRNRPAARQFADSILANAPRAMSGILFFDADVHSSLALAYAIKGDNQRRLKETEQTIEKVPVSVDAERSTQMLVYLANSAVLAGSYDEALTQLRQVLAVPSFYSSASLRVDPWFDLLRGDRRFQQLLATYD